MPNNFTKYWPIQSFGNHLSIIACSFCCNFMMTSLLLERSWRRTSTWWEKSRLQQQLLVLHLQLQHAQGNSVPTVCISLYNVSFTFYHFPVIMQSISILLKDWVWDITYLWAEICEKGEKGVTSCLRVPSSLLYWLPEGLSATLGMPFEQLLLFPRGPVTQFGWNVSKFIYKINH